MADAEGNAGNDDRAFDVFFAKCFEEETAEDGFFDDAHADPPDDGVVYIYFAEPGVGSQERNNLLAVLACLRL